MVTSALKSGTVLSDIAIATEAQSFGHKLGTNPSFCNDAEDIADAKEVSARGPIAFYLDMKATFTTDELRGFAIPDTDKDSPEIVGTNRRADKFPTIIVVGSKPRKGTGSWWKEMARATPVVKGWQRHLDMIAEAGAKAAVRPTDPELLELYRMYCDMSNTTRETYEKKYIARISSVVSALKDGWWLFYQLEQFAEHLSDGVIVEIKMEEVKDAAGKVIGQKLANVKQPIVVEDKKDKTKFQVYSVGSFLNLNPKLAAENGGNLTAVRETAGREPTPEDKSGPKVPSAKAFGDFANMMSHALIRDLRSELLSAISAKSEDADELIFAVGTLYEQLDGFITPVLDRFHRIENAKLHAAGRVGQEETKTAA